MQKREPLIHFKRDLCFLKLTGKSNLKVRKSYSSGSQASAWEGELVVALASAVPGTVASPHPYPPFPEFGSVQPTDFI